MIIRVFLLIGFLLAIGCSQVSNDGRKSQTAEHLKLRFDAAELIDEGSAKFSRDQVFRQLAIDAKMSENADVMKKAIEKIKDLNVKNDTARYCAEYGR